MKRPAQPALLEITQTALTENSDDSEDRKHGHDLEKGIGLLTAGSSYSEQSYAKNSIVGVHALTGARRKRTQKCHGEGVQQHPRTNGTVFERPAQFGETRAMMGRIFARDRLTSFGRGHVFVEKFSVEKSNFCAYFLVIIGANDGAPSQLPTRDERDGLTPSADATECIPPEIKKPRQGIAPCRGSSEEPNLKLLPQREQN